MSLTNLGYGALKYVIIREEEGGVEYPFFTCAPVSHADMATAWRRDDTRRVVGAGFCQISATHVITYGFSTSLIMGPRDEDARLIAAFARVTCKLNPIDNLGATNTHSIPQ